MPRIKELGQQLGQRLGFAPTEEQRFIRELDINPTELKTFNTDDCFDEYQKRYLQWLVQFESVVDQVIDNPQGVFFRQFETLSNLLELQRKTYDQDLPVKAYEIRFPRIITGDPSTTRKHVLQIIFAHTDIEPEQRQRLERTSPSFESKFQDEYIYDLNDDWDLYISHSGYKKNKFGEVVLIPKYHPEYLDYWQEQKLDSVVTSLDPSVIEDQMLQYATEDFTDLNLELVDCREDEVRGLDNLLNKLAEEGWEIIPRENRESIRNLLPAHVAKNDLEEYTTLLKHKLMGADQPVLRIERHTKNSDNVQLKISAVATKGFHRRIETEVIHAYGTQIGKVMSETMARRDIGPVEISIYHLIHDTFLEFQEYYRPTVTHTGILLRYTYQALLESLEEESDLEDTYSLLKALWAAYEVQEDAEYGHYWGWKPGEVCLKLPQRNLTN